MKHDLIENRELDQQQRLRKRHLKRECTLLQTFGVYSISFNSSDFGKFFRSSILQDCIKVQEKKKKVVFLCSRPRQNMK